MTCRHQWGDPKCGSFEDQLTESIDLVTNFLGNPNTTHFKKELKKAKELVEKHSQENINQNTPDSYQFVIEKICRKGPHLVIQARYPNCAKCSYEGTKTMAFLNVTELDVIRWKKIDPHFSDPKEKRAVDEAPSPAARFPASEKGWCDAIQYISNIKA